MKKDDDRRFKLKMARRKREKTCFFVTTLRRDGKVEPKRDTRCIGYYEELKWARNTVETLSIDEGGWYKYAVIEEFGQGWYPNVHQEIWYQFYKTRKPKQIKKPARFNRIRNFGLG